MTLHPDAGSQPRFRDLLWQFFPARIWGKCGDFRPFSFFVLHLPPPPIKIVIRPFSQPFGVFRDHSDHVGQKVPALRGFSGNSLLMISRPGIFERFENLRATTLLCGEAPESHILIGKDDAHRHTS